jgi:hypothetical protein
MNIIINHPNIGESLKEQGKVLFSMLAPTIFRELFVSDEEIIQEDTRLYMLDMLYNDFEAIANNYGLDSDDHDSMDFIIQSASDLIRNFNCPIKAMEDTSLAQVYVEDVTVLDKNTVMLSFA